MRLPWICFIKTESVGKHYFLLTLFLNTVAQTVSMYGSSLVELQDPVIELVVNIDIKYFYLFVGCEHLLSENVSAPQQTLGTLQTSNCIGLMRIRHSEFLANRCRKQKLAKIRRWLGQVYDEQAADESESAEANNHPA